jgi:hypothetical protein
VNKAVSTLPQGSTLKVSMVSLEGNGMGTLGQGSKGVPSLEKHQNPSLETQFSKLARSPKSKFEFDGESIETVALIPLHCYQIQSNREPKDWPSRWGACCACECET